MAPQPLSAKSRVGAFCTPLQGWEASCPILCGNPGSETPLNSKILPGPWVLLSLHSWGS